MSEHEAYVACTCFRDGLTSDPPVPRTSLTFDRFGNVMLVTSATPEDDPEVVRVWRSGTGDDSSRACPHDDMRVIEEIWWAPAPADDADAATVAARGVSGLGAILAEGSSFSNAVVLATPGRAASALPELEDLLLGLSEPPLYLRRLRDLLQAVITTGNPLVGFHNGCSGGYA